MHQSAKKNQNTCTTSCISWIIPCCSSSCSVEDEEHQYRLHVSGFSGTVQDSFSWYHDKQGFSTPDSGNICAEISHGGWWYNQCFYANLNGVYYRVSAHRPLFSSFFLKSRVFTTFWSCREATTRLKAGGRWVLMASFGTPGKTLTITPCAKSAWWSGHAASEPACHPEPWHTGDDDIQWCLTELIRKEANDCFCWEWTYTPTWKSERELRELNVLETVDSFFCCIFSKNTLYCRVPFWDIFHSVRWKSSSSFSTSVLYLLVWYFDTHC